MIVTAIETEEFKITEIGPLPQDWEVEPFDNVRVKAIGRIPPSIPVTGYQTQGKYPIIDQSANYIAGYTDDDSRILREQLPVVIFGDHTRIFKFVNFPFAIGADGTKIIYPNSDAYNPKFLYYYFLSLDIPRRGYNRHFRILREQKIARPPLPEQKRITYFLSTVQTAIEKTEAVIRATRELKKSLMKHLFTYGPVSLDEAENVPLKEIEIGLVPEKWEVDRLGEITHKLIGGGTPSTGRSEYWGGDIHWTTSKRITGIRLTEGEKRITSKGLEESSTHLVPKGNLIIGTRVGVGKVAINEVDMAISQDLTGAIVDTNKYVPEFLAYQISTDRIQGIFEQCSRGTTIKGIPRDELSKILLVIPSRTIQKKIADAISAVDARIEAEENKKKALEALFKTMLSNLMIGKIRVNNLEVPV